MNSKQLDFYSLLIVSKYFKTKEDYINIICVNSKFKETTEKLCFNPITIFSTKLFPKIQTQYLYSKNDMKINDINHYELWYEIDYEQYLKCKENNIKFYTILYTYENREKHGDIIPDNINKLGDWCYVDDSHLTSIKLPSTIKSLGEYCFYNCESLKSITLSSSLTSIGNECFFNCSSLNSINLPSTTIVFGHACFYECSKLKGNITVPDSCFQ